MTIAVLGANGKSGTIFVQHALAAGHSVRAGVFGADCLQPHQNLVVLQTNIMQLTDINALLIGADAVVSLVGHGSRTPPGMQSKGTQNIVQSMQTHGIKKFVSLTGTGVRIAGDCIRLADRIIVPLLWLLDKKRMQDGQDFVDVLRSSGLQWSVLRVMKLDNAPARSYVLTLHGPPQYVTSRYDVADALLELLSSDAMSCALPVISGT